MELNYRRLMYFWALAREGNVGRTSELLGRTPSALLAQLRELEEEFGQELLVREANGQVSLTVAGEAAFRYADEIFSLGRELVASLNQLSADRPLLLRVGFTPTLPRDLAALLLRPVYGLDRPVQVVATHAVHETLLEQLLARQIDVAISEEPGYNAQDRPSISHLLGESSITLLAAPDLARRLRPSFPHSLHESPMLLPTETAPLRARLDRWFKRWRIQPRVLGECDVPEQQLASAVYTPAIVAVHTAVAAAHIGRYGLEAIGVADGCAETFYCISPETKLPHPAITAIQKAAGSLRFDDLQQSPPVLQLHRAV